MTTLRRLIAFIDPLNRMKDSKNSLLLLEGKGPDYASTLAELLSHKELKILVLELRFDEIKGSSDSGLLPYLEGKIQKPEILHLAGYDKIASGGICRYANELVGSKRFQDLLATLTPQYDWILISSNASPKSAEAESLLALFRLSVITITEETLHDLKNCLQHANKQKNQVAFVMAPQVP